MPINYALIDITQYVKYGHFQLNLMENVNPLRKLGLSLPRKSYYESVIY